MNRTLRRARLALWLVFAFAAAGATSSCAPATAPSSGQVIGQNPAPTSSGSLVGQSPAPASIDQIDEILGRFHGPESALQIGAELDRALTFYGLEPTYESRSRAATVVVALQDTAEAHGCARCTAIAILREMQSHGRAASLTFEEAAGLAAAGLELGATN
jgi:hypothetical protein